MIFHVIVKKEKYLYLSSTIYFLNTRREDEDKSRNRKNQTIYFPNTRREDEDKSRNRKKSISPDPILIHTHSWGSKAVSVGGEGRSG